MAASINDYGKAGMHIALGDLDWAADTIKMAFVTSGYTPDRGNHEFFSDITNELTTGGGYAAGGYALAGKAASYDAGTREYRFDADDVNIAALTPSSPFRYGIIYKSTGVAGTSILIALVNFAADQNPGGLPFPIQWAATGVTYIVAP